MNIRMHRPTKISPTNRDPMLCRRLFGDLGSAFRRQAFGPLLTAHNPAQPSKSDGSGIFLFGGFLLRRLGVGRNLVEDRPGELLGVFRWFFLA